MISMLGACNLQPLAHPNSATSGGGGELELSRAEHHRALSRGLAADKTHLGEVLRNQRRALLAAQLAENRAVEEALAAAPEQLRCVCAWVCCRGARGCVSQVIKLSISRLKVK
eukprot:scaffold254587_cov17-Tisochrysis_lutea.AAC.1